MLLIAARAMFLPFLIRPRHGGLHPLAARRSGAHLRSCKQHQVVLQRLADLEARVAATNVAVSQLGERVERPQQLAAAPAAASPGYQIAIRLAKGGAPREELISKCGLSIHEAELVHRLHAPQARPPARKTGPGHSHAA